MRTVKLLEVSANFWFDSSANKSFNLLFDSIEFIWVSNWAILAFTSSDSCSIKFFNNSDKFLYVSGNSTSLLLSSTSFNWLFDSTGSESWKTFVQHRILRNAFEVDGLVFLTAIWIRIKVRNLEKFNICLDFIMLIL